MTKSGTNEFDGSVFYAYKDDSFVGNSFDGGNFDPGEFEEEGIRLHARRPDHQGQAVLLCLLR